MIAIAQKTLLKLAAEENPKLAKLELLRQKINNEEYLHEAIQRIALIISNELLDLHPGGRPYGHKRKGRSWPRK